MNRHFSRRKAPVRLAAAAALSVLTAAALMTCVDFAAAQDESYPNRPVKVIQPSAAGGPSDVMIRVIADALEKRLGQPVIVENRPGAAGVIGAEAALKAPADGYTLLSIGSFHFSTAALRTKMPYDAVEDFTGISLLTRAPMVLVANKDFPANTLAEVIELAKKSPTGLTYTSPNFGGVPFLSGQLLMRAADIKLQHVTYRGSPAALVDVIAGRVPLMVDLWSSSKQYVESGQLKVIAVVTKYRLADAPQYPLMNDMFPVFDYTVNNALIVAAETPKNIIEKLTKQVHAVVDMPAVQAKMRSLGMIPMTSTPDEYNTLARNEVAKWRELARANGITLQ